MVHLRVKSTSMDVSFQQVTISVLQCCDIPRVVDYLIENYFPYAPLARYVKLMECPEAVQYLREFSSELLRQNISVVAKNDSGCIVGVACNAVIKKNQTFDFGVHPDINRIADFIMDTANNSHIFVRYEGVDSYLYVAFLSVHEGYRNQGLSKRLLDKSRKLAVKLGLDVIRIDCCSLEAAKTARRVGFKCLKDIEFAEYKVNDQQVFYPDEPLATFGVYAMKTKGCGSLMCI